MIISSCLFGPLSQTCWIYISCICSACWCCRFSNNYFFRRNSSSNDFSNSTTSPISRRMNKKFLIRIVLSVSLIVKLNIIPVNHISYCFMDSLIASINVFKKSNKVRCLRTMRNIIFLLVLLLSLLKDVINSLSAKYEPLFT